MEAKTRANLIRMKIAHAANERKCCGRVIGQTHYWFQPSVLVITGRAQILFLLCELTQLCSILNTKYNLFPKNMDGALSYSDFKKEKNISSSEQLLGTYNRTHCTVYRSTDKNIDYFTSYRTQLRVFNTPPHSYRLNAWVRYSTFITINVTVFNKNSKCETTESE